MKRTMLIGETHSGKSSLISALSGEHYEPRKVLALKYFHSFVDTPGEFLENRRFFHALITASGECDVLLFVQDATMPTCRIPPGFASMFNRHVVGVITKCDLPAANIHRARKFLRNAGVQTMIIETSSKTGQGLELLREQLAGRDRTREPGSGAGQGG